MTSKTWPKDGGGSHMDIILRNKVMFIASFEEFAMGCHNRLVKYVANENKV